jgi:hypothetical protein
LPAEARLVGWIFRVAALYGVVVLLPMYFLAVPDPYRLTQLGFVGLALVFQVVFWVIGGDPVRFRPLVPLAVAEKAVFGIPALAFFVLGRTDGFTALFAAIDVILGAVFVWAFLRLRRLARTTSSR